MKVCLCHLGLTNSEQKKRRILRNVRFHTHPITLPAVLIWKVLRQAFRSYHYLWNPSTFGWVIALFESFSRYLQSLTLSAPNDVDLRFAVFLLWAKRRRPTSKYLNFPPYDVIGIKLKSWFQSPILLLNDRIWYLLKEENLGYLFGSSGFAVNSPSNIKMFKGFSITTLP
jgi:hypothetical protein